MTVASADRQYQRKQGEYVYYPVVATDIIYKGTLVTTPVGDATNSGYAKPGTNELFGMLLGVADIKVDNSAGLIGADKVKVWKTGTFEFVFSGTATQADVGKTVYIVDDQTVGFEGLTTAFMVEAGKIVEYVDATTVRVEIDAAVDKFPDIYTYPLITGASVTRGDSVCQADSEYAGEGADTANYFFLGISIETVACTGASGTALVHVVKDCIVYHGSSQAIATYQIGDLVYVDGAAAFDTAAGTANVDMLYARVHRKPASGNYAYLRVQQLKT